ncbi:hypothetical protein [Roseicella aquatilis]|nr:hypothetical protein [Roseicella aquatilis]
MDDDDPGDAPDTTEDGFVLLEGWMFGAMMYPAAADRIREYPPANDNEG